MENTTRYDIGCLPFDFTDKENSNHGYKGAGNRQGCFDAIFLREGVIIRKNIEIEELEEKVKFRDAVIENWKKTKIKTIKILIALAILISLFSFNYKPMDTIIQKIENFIDTQITEFKDSPVKTGIKLYIIYYIFKRISK